MASDWGTFSINMKAVFGSPNQKSISDIAEIHAKEYVAAVSSASIILTSSKVTVKVTKATVKSAYVAAFTQLFNEKEQIKANYKEIQPRDPVAEGNARDKLKSIFKPVAAAICAEWAKEIFTAGTVPPGYVSPTVGYVVLVPGDPDALAQDLAKAFYIAQTETDQQTAVNVHIASLIEAYTKHLLKITGLFNGLIPGAPPVPGPPFPFVGVA
jgi:hypothetical protein